MIMSGKDKGKTGKVVKAFPRENKIIVAGVNIRKVHKRATKSGQKGQIIEQAAPIHVSNSMLVDPKGGKPTKVEINRDSGKRVRIAKKSKTVIQ